MDVTLKLPDCTTGDVDPDECYIEASKPLADAIKDMQAAFDDLQLEIDGKCAELIEEAEDSLINFKQQNDSLNDSFESMDPASADVSAFEAEYTRCVDDTNEAMLACAPEGVEVEG